MPNRKRDWFLHPIESVKRHSRSSSRTSSPQPPSTSTPSSLTPQPSPTPQTSSIPQPSSAPQPSNPTNVTFIPSPPAASQAARPSSMRQSPLTEPAQNDYMKLAGLDTSPPAPQTPGQRMRKGAGIAYSGLKQVAQALSEFSDVFPPLQTAIKIFLKIDELVDVRNYTN
jgi:hypothetical protein